MALPRPLNAAIFFLVTTSARVYSMPSYEGIRLAFPATSRLIYTASEANPASSGYSYATQDSNGDGSNVVFVTGADSMSRLRNEMSSINEAMGMSERYTQREMLNKTRKNLMSSEQRSKSEEIKASTNKQEDFDSNIKVFNEEKKLSKNPETHNFIELPHQVSFAPYPTFRANLVDSYFSVILPRHHLAQNVIHNQYYPHNPYAHLELPLHNLDFYDPIASWLYQTPITATASDFRQALTVAENAKITEGPGIIENSQINATVSESNSMKSDIIESKSNLKSVTNAVEEALLSKSTISKLESMNTSEKVKEETTTTESMNTVVKSETSSMKESNMTTPSVNN